MLLFQEETIPEEKKKDIFRKNALDIHKTIYNHHILLDTVYTQIVLY